MSRHGASLSRFPVGSRGLSPEALSECRLCVAPSGLKRAHLFKYASHPRSTLRHPAAVGIDVFLAALSGWPHAVAARNGFGFVRPDLVCACDPAARSLERHLLWPGNHVQHPYFPAFGYGPGRVAGPFQDAVSHSGDPVDILRHAAFRRHPEAYPAPPPPMPVLDSGQGRPLARAFAAPPFLSGYSLQAGKRLSGSVRVPNYVWCSDFT